MWLIFALLLGNLLGEKKNKKPCLKVTTDLLPGEAFFGCAEAVEPGFPGSRRSVWQQQGVSCEALQDSWVAVRWQLEQKLLPHSSEKNEKHTMPELEGAQGRSSPAPDPLCTEHCAQKGPKPNSSPQHSANVSSYLWSQIRIGILIP